MKVSHYQDIGGYLRDSRESLRIPIEHAAEDLHIRVKYLHAIEMGEFEGLPGKAYIRGYIKNYVEYLQLDAREVLEAYESLFAHKGREFFVPDASLHQNLPTRRILVWSLIGLILLYLYWYFSVHDRSKVEITSEMPEKFVQLLDKTPPSAMDRDWEDCLNAPLTYNECFYALQARIPPMHGTFYDINITHPPLKP